MFIVGYIRKFLANRAKQRSYRRRRATVTIVAAQAAVVLNDGGRFAMPCSFFEDDDHIRSLLVALSKKIGRGVRASAGEGLIFIYDESAEYDGLKMTVGVRNEAFAEVARFQAQGRR